MPEHPHVQDAYAPREIALKVEQLGVAKAQAGSLSLLVLAVLGGAFIALGALFYLVLSTGSTLGFGPTRALGGLGFSLGLILVVVAGAELFTGNNLLAMAWASRRVSTPLLLRHWLLAYAGNVLGAAGCALLAWLAGLDALAQGQLGETALRIAQAKAALSPTEALARGVLCNALVCLAVWLALAGRSVADKVLAIVFPVTAFVAIGAEHCIANWFFLPYAWALDGQGTLALPALAANLAWVTVGNLLGGTLLVAGVYWLAYLRQPAA
ncbi:MAG: formate/nitrite transporter family protein [Inhella sp.]